MKNKDVEEKTIRIVLIETVIQYLVNSNLYENFEEFENLLNKTLPKLLSFVGKINICMDHKKTDVIGKVYYIDENSENKFVEFYFCF